VTNLKTKTSQLNQFIKRKTCTNAKTCMDSWTMAYIFKY